MIFCAASHRAAVQTLRNAQLSGLSRAKQCDQQQGCSDEGFDEFREQFFTSASVRKAQGIRLNGAEFYRLQAPKLQPCRGIKSCSDSVDLYSKNSVSMAYLSLDLSLDRSLETA
ncbi:MAG: hypothetical protein DHS20C12_22900 [Pseudohongiella sp.]|nr:MAG: hypothetical protein DHS20C12_22900 [Pseudohongiella sp.]